MHLSIFRKILKWLVGVFFIYLFIALLFENVAVFNRYQHYIIVSGSMQPTIDIGDVVIINRQFDIDTLESDTIIAFNTEINSNEVVVVHYLDSIVAVNGNYEIRTRPEGTDALDDWVLSENDLIGVYQWHIPRLGRFLFFTQSTIGRIVIIIDVILIYLIIRFFFKKKPS